MSYLGCRINTHCTLSRCGSPSLLTASCQQWGLVHDEEWNDYHCAAKTASRRMADGCPDRRLLRHLGRRRDSALAALAARGACRDDADGSTSIVADARSLARPPRP